MPVNWLNPNAPFLRRCSPPQNCTSWAWRRSFIRRQCKRDRSPERRACTNSGSTARCCGNFQNGHPPNSSVLYIRREEKFWGWIWSGVGAEVGGVGRCRRPAKAAGSAIPQYESAARGLGSGELVEGGLVGVHQVYCFDTLP